MCNWGSHDSACPAGVQITCVEMGADLAAVGRQNLAGFLMWKSSKRPSRRGSRMEQPPSTLVFAATAWHWIDPAVKYRRAWELLRPGGHLAFWTAAPRIPSLWRSVLPRHSERLRRDRGSSPARHPLAGRRRCQRPERLGPREGAAGM